MTIYFVAKIAHVFLRRNNTCNELKGLMKELKEKKDEPEFLLLALTKVLRTTIISHPLFSIDSLPENLSTESELESN